MHNIYLVVIYNKFLDESETINSFLKWDNNLSAKLRIWDNSTLKEFSDRNQVEAEKIANAIYTHSNEN